MTLLRVVFGAGLLAAVLSGCGDDDDGPMLSEAQRTGVGAACAADSACAQSPVALECLEFKGGYCGLRGCTSSADCPFGSACVAHEDGENYCFLVCTDKLQCNPTRPVSIESNCSSNITFAGDDRGKKACVPPS